MPVTVPKTSKFLNSREWRSFVGTARAAASYPSVMRAVRAGQAWLAGGPAATAPLVGSTTGWLLADGSDLADPAETVRI
jgi:hypothetical protein